VTALQVLLMMALVLTGPRGSSGLNDYVDAIAHTDATPEEQLVLLTIGFRENTYHIESRTPSFGVTDYAAHHPDEVITVQRGADLALRFIRLIRRARCPGSSLAVVLGRYHHGNGVDADIGMADTTRRPGCYADALSRRQTEDVARMRYGAAHPTSWMLHDAERRMEALRHRHLARKTP
jgi:hypothetical protein